MIISILQSTMYHPTLETAILIKMTTQSTYLTIRYHAHEIITLPVLLEAERHAKITNVLCVITTKFRKADLIFYNQYSEKQPAFQVNYIRWLLYIDTFIN